MKEMIMPKMIFFAAIIVTCLAISTGSSADSHSSTNQKENAVDQQSRQIVTIQVSSHKKADDADREKSRLISRGLDAVVDFEQVKDKGMWYRVYIGQFETREAANIFAKDLVEKGIIAGYWVKKKKVPTEALNKEKERQGAAVATATIIQTPDDKTTVTPSETSSPPSQSTIAEEAGSSQLSLTKETQPPEAENKVTENADQKEAPAALQVNADISKQDQSRISLGVKASVLASHKTGEFKVTKSDNGATESWSFGDTYLFFGIVGNYRLNDTFTIESSLEKDIMENIDNWLLTVAVKYQLQPIGRFTPYLRGGAIIGRMTWDDMPGDFDTGIGLEGGLGMHLTKSRFRLGLEASYRYMKYNYNPPGSDNITFTDDHLDMSGLVLSGTLSYLF
jgi:opacity protein-like surface antigen